MISQSLIIISINLIHQDFLSLHQIIEMMVTIDLLPNDFDLFFVVVNYLQTYSCNDYWGIIVRILNIIKRSFSILTIINMVV